MTERRKLEKKNFDEKSKDRGNRGGREGINSAEGDIPIVLLTPDGTETDPSLGLGHTGKDSSTCESDGKERGDMEDNWSVSRQIQTILLTETQMNFTLGQEVSEDNFSRAGTGAREETLERRILIRQTLIPLKQARIPLDNSVVLLLPVGRHILTNQNPPLSC